MKTRGVPLAELRRRFAPGGAAVTPSVLAALREDGRAGARELASALARRRGRDRTERRRVRRLFDMERTLREEGCASICGVDEVGMGPLAGPVVAAAVILPDDAHLTGLDDSKRLPRARREELHDEIQRIARAVSIGWASPEEIDEINIYQAGLLAMRRAVRDLELTPEVVLVDARTIPDLPSAQRAVKGGDGQVASIAAASVVAKVYRDAWLRDLDRRHPGYGFARNSGYATAEHLRSLGEQGPSPIHRYSFAPVREAAERRRARVRLAPAAAPRSGPPGSAGSASRPA